MPMLPKGSNRQRYSVRSLQKSNTQSCVKMDCYFLFLYQIWNTQAACDTEGTSILVQLGPEHEIHLCSARMGWY